MQLVVTVVLAGNEQSGDLKPDICFLPKILQRIQYRLKLRKAEPMIKRVSERLEIDIRCIHAPVKFRTRVGGDVAGCDRDSFDSAFTPSISDVDRVLGENHRVFISERYRSAPKAFRGESDLMGRRGIRQLVPFARFGDVPVLAKPAAEIAPRSAGRGPRGPGRTCGR